MQAAIDDGSLTKEAYETALRNMFRVRMRLGQFDPVEQQPYLRITTASIDTVAHQALALSAARQGITLLKNKNGVLPLSKANTKTLALIGPNAAATGTMQGNYQGTAPFLISPQQGFSEYTAVNYLKGCDIDSSDTSGLKDAVAAAAIADATVLVVGLTGAQEGEGHDRTDISLPGVQEQLIAEVSAAAKGPVTLVVMSGGTVDISAAKANPKVGAIMWVGYPGQAGGTAIAETVFGDNNPAGRLTQTWYPKDYVTKCSMFDMNMRPNATTGCPGRSYRFYTGNAVYKFGDGMGYSKMAYSQPNVTGADGISFTSMSKPIVVPLEAVHEGIRASSHAPHLAPPMVSFEFDISNMGEIDGDEVVLVFVKSPLAGQNGFPLKELKGFTRQHVPAKSTQKVTMSLSPQDLKLADDDGLFTSKAGEWTVEIGAIPALSFKLLLQ